MNGITDNRSHPPENDEQTSLVSHPSQNSENSLESGTTQISEEPWPSSFERSISLLSTPVMNVRKIDLVTQSPKPGNTPLLLSKNRSLNHTPEVDARRLIRPSRTRSYGSYDELSNCDFRTNLSGKVELGITKKKQQADVAKKYRQNFLEEQRRLKNEDATKSPGFDRERQYDRQAKKKEKGANEEKSTFSQCVFNMSNILMGVGILGLPFVFSSAGWIGGSLVLLIFCSTTCVTAKMIGRQLNGDNRPCSFFEDSTSKTYTTNGSHTPTRVRSPLTSFPQIAREAFGSWGSIILSSILYFELFSCLCVFLVTISDHLSSLFPAISRSLHMTGVCVVLSIPTALLRTPRLLSYLSMVGTMATVLVVLSVLTSALFEGDISEKVSLKVSEAEPTHIMWDISGLPIALGLVAYCYSGHAIVPSIYTSMKQPQKFEYMIDLSFLIVLGSCFVVAVSGYYMFGSSVEDQVTISLEHHSSVHFAMKCLTWLMVLTAFSKFTLTMFPLAIGIEELLAPYVYNEKSMIFIDIIIKISLIILAFGVALLVPSFSFICAIVGLVCTMTVSVIFPAAAHLKLFCSDLSAAEKIFCWILIIFGTTVAIVGTISTI